MQAERVCCPESPRISVVLDLVEGARSLPQYGSRETLQVNRIKLGGVESFRTPSTHTPKLDKSRLSARFSRRTWNADSLPRAFRCCRRLRIDGTRHRAGRCGTFAGRRMFRKKILGKTQWNGLDCVWLGHREAGCVGYRLAKMYLRAKAGR